MSFNVFIHLLLTWIPERKRIMIYYAIRIINLLWLKRNIHVFFWAYFIYPTRSNLVLKMIFCIRNSYIITVPSGIFLIINTTPNLGPQPQTRRRYWSWHKLFWDQVRFSIVTFQQFTECTKMFHWLPGGKSVRNFEKALMYSSENLLNQKILLTWDINGAYYLPDKGKTMLARRFPYPGAQIMPTSHRMAG